MVITDLTAPAERPAALSRLGLCFGVGMILGSLLGGTLSTAYG
jgi:OCT family organic cation transporter-like MFS transporter 18